MTFLDHWILWMVAFGVIAIVLAILTGWAAESFDFLPLLIGLATVASAIFAFIVIPVNHLDHEHDKTSCARYGVATGRDTKLVTYSSWTWDCLTPSATHGKWVPIDSLREVSGVAK